MGAHCAPPPPTGFSGAKNSVNVKEFFSFKRILHKFLKERKKNAMNKNLKKIILDEK